VLTHHRPGAAGPIQTSVPPPFEKGRRRLGIKSFELESELREYTDVMARERRYSIVSVHNVLVLGELNVGKSSFIYRAVVQEEIQAVCSVKC
jgi:hypothetical protein